MEKIPSPKGKLVPASEHLRSAQDASQMSRRRFMSGLGAGVISASIGLPHNANANVDRSPRPAPRPTVESREAEREYLKEQVYAAYEPIVQQALRYTSALEQDLDTVVEAMRAITADDERFPSVAHLLYETLTLPNIPEPIGETLRDFMMYVPYIESRFDTTAESAVGAFGILQLMPEAWDELSQEGEVKEKIIDQITVAGRLLQQIYQHLMNTHADTFALVAEVLFDGDTERCDREFIGPIILNGYFSGMGTMEQVLEGFLADYITITEHERMRARGIDQDTMGVFGVCVKAAEIHGYAKNYGSESGKYIPKIIAAKNVLHAGLPQQWLSELLPQVGSS